MTSRKRILLITDADGLWTQRFIEFLLPPEEYEITLFPIWGDGGRYTDYYRQRGVTVYRDLHTLPVISRIPRVRMWARVALNAAALKKLGPFDIVHNHYLSQRDLSLGKRLALQYRARWICSFWGSDLMRSPKKELRRMAPYLRLCDGITVHSELNREQIRREYGEAVAQKTTLLYFGQIGYQNIDAARERFTKAECKAAFGIDSSRYVICVGYNASSAQNQLPVLEAMAALPKERLSRVALVLQQTYAQNDDDYVRRTRELAGRLPCQTVVLTEFMNGEDSAKLRLAADLFILAIQTDAFSGSLQEYLYAGADVLRGEWLGYPQLDEMGVSVPSFRAYNELPALILRAMDGKHPSLTQEQRALFPMRYSWDAVRESWMRLYR